jgi:hypothetical protein
MGINNKFRICFLTEVVNIFPGAVSLLGTLPGAAAVFQTFIIIVHYYIKE